MLGRSVLVSLATAAIALLAIAPAGVQAAGNVTATLGPSGILTITGDAAEADQMAIVTVSPSGGSPDLVVGDLTAGIASIPPNCFAIDPTAFRCPQSMVGQININLGGGNDTLTAKGIRGSLAEDLHRIYMRAYMGGGNDVAEGSPGRNVIVGGPGHDMIMGGPLGDQLFGGAQNDFLVGLGGNDLFQCGKGNRDLFNDGPGKDLVNIRSCEERVHRQFVP